MNQNSQSNPSNIAQRAATGDTEAFEQLIADSYRRVYYIAYSWLTDTQAAEDVTQETFVRALLSLSTLKDPSALASWINTIARNLAKDRLRSQRREERYLEKIVSEYAVMENSGSHSPDHSRTVAEQAEAIQRLNTALSKIDPETREILLLRYVHELTQEEISRQLDIPNYTISRRIESGYTKLRELLSGTDIPNLAMLLKPNASLFARTIAVTAAVAGLNANSHAALLNALNKQSALPPDIPSPAPAPTPTPTPIASTPASPSSPWAFLTTGFGKITIFALAVSGVILAGNSLINKNKYNQTKTTQAQSSQHDPDSVRHNGAGDSIRTKGNTATTTSRSQRNSGAGSSSLKDYAVVEDKTLTCPMLMVYGRILNSDESIPTTGIIELIHDGTTLAGIKNSNKVVASQLINSNDDYSLTAPDGKGFYLKFTGLRVTYHSVKNRESEEKRILKTTRKNKINIFSPIAPIEYISGKVLWRNTLEPVINADVSQSVSSQAPWLMQQNFSVKTDANGNFTFPKNTEFINSLGAIAVGSAPSSIKLDHAFPTGINILLDKAKSGFQATIINYKNNTPLSNAKIYLKEKSNEDQFYLQFPRIVSANDNGEFQLPRFTSGTVEIMITDKNDNPFYPNNGGLKWEIVKAYDETTSTVLTGYSTIDVQGIVKDRSGKPVSNVKIFAPTPSHTPFTSTDDSGYFKLEDIPEIYGQKQTAIVAERDNLITDKYLSKGVSGETFYDRSSFNLIDYPRFNSIDKNYLIDNNLNHTFSLNMEKQLSGELISIVMQNVVKFTGRINGPNGEAINNAHIIALTTEGAIEANSDSNGTFSMNLPENYTFMLKINAKGYGFGTTNFVSPKNVNLPFEITLPKETIIYGNLSDNPDYSNFPTLKIFSFQDNKKTEIPYPIDYEYQRQETGKYYFDQLPPGDYILQYGRGMTIESEIMRLGYDNSPLKRDLTIETIRPRNIMITFYNELGKQVPVPNQYMQGSQLMGFMSHGKPTYSIPVFFQKIPSDFTFFYNDPIYEPVHITHPPSKSDNLDITLRKKQDLITFQISKNGVIVTPNENQIIIINSPNYGNSGSGKNSLDVTTGMITASKRDKVKITIDNNLFDIPMEKLNNGDIYDVIKKQ